MVALSTRWGPVGNGSHVPSGSRYRYQAPDGPLTAPLTAWGVSGDHWTPRRTHVTIRRHGDLLDTRPQHRPMDDLPPEAVQKVREVMTRLEIKRTREPAARRNAGVVEHLTHHAIEQARELQMPYPEYRVPASVISLLHSCNYMSRIGATTTRSNGNMTLEDCPCRAVRRLPQFEGDFASFWEGKNSGREDDVKMFARIGAALIAAMSIIFIIWLIIQVAPGAAELLPDTGK